MFKNEDITKNQTKLQTITIIHRCVNIQPQVNHLEIHFSLFVSADLCYLSRFPDD